MKTLRVIGTLIVITNLGAPAYAQNSDTSAGFHFPVGLTYASGISTVGDRLDTLFNQAGFTTTSKTVIPIGLSISPYYEFDCGLGIGADMGPISFIAIDQSGGGSGGGDISYIIPVGANVRYSLFRDQPVSPYVRAGFKYPIVGGPNVSSSQAGVFGAVGVDFWHTKRIGLALEVGYDDSKVTVKGPTGATSSVTFPGFTVSILGRF